MTSFTEIAERIIDNLSEAEASAPAAADEGTLLLLLESVRHVTKSHGKELDSLLSRRRVRAAASVTKRECELMRYEGTKVFQVGREGPLLFVDCVKEFSTNVHAF